MSDSTLTFTQATIVLMRESDVATVLDIERRSNPHPWSERNFFDALRSGYLCLVAREDKAIVGFAVLRSLIDEAELLLIAVRPESRRSGCASGLLADVQARMRALEKTTLHIEARQSNAGALAFYAARGFTRIGVRKNYYPSGVLGNQREDAVLMSITL
jgi:ribosomal-protein-alanine acetyltransferase